VGSGWVYNCPFLPKMIKPTSRNAIIQCIGVYTFSKITMSLCPPRWYQQPYWLMDYTRFMTFGDTGIFGPILLCPLCSPSTLVVLHSNFAQTYIKSKYAPIATSIETHLDPQTPPG
jgi:hypothetical protein